MRAKGYADRVGHSALLTFSYESVNQMCLLGGGYHD